jgi:hypothetical protein
MTNDKRHFSDEEFALVLRKAMELQEGGSGLSLPSEGLSLEDMRAVARDVGIDPALVDRAVSLLPEKQLSLVARATGGPTRYRLEHSGPTVEKDDLSRILDVIRRETGHHGKVTNELDGITWETVGEVSQVHVSLAPRDGGTEVRLTVNRDAAFMLTWFFSVLGALVGAGITGAIVEPATVLGGVGIVGAALGGGLTLARTLWGRSTKAVREKTHRLMEMLTREIGTDSEE